MFIVLILILLITIILIFILIQMKHYVYCIRLCFSSNVYKTNADVVYIAADTNASKTHCLRVYICV